MHRVRNEHLSVVLRTLLLYSGSWKVSVEKNATSGNFRLELDNLYYEEYEQRLLTNIIENINFSD